MEKNCILTDLGHTLIYDNKHQLYKEALAQLNIYFSEEEIDLAFHKADKHIMKFYPKMFMSNTNSYMELYLGMVNYYLQIQPDLLKCAHEYQRLINKGLYNWKIYDGVTDTLSKFRDAGFKMVLVSNWDHTGRDILNELDMIKFFDEMIISCEVGFEKPAKEIFKIALKKAQMEKEECLFIGDNYYDDGVGSELAGIDYVIINRHKLVGVETLNCPIVSSFNDLPLWLHRKNAA